MVLSNTYLTCIHETIKFRWDFIRKNRLVGGSSFGMETRLGDFVKEYIYSHTYMYLPYNIVYIYIILYTHALCVHASVCSLFLPFPILYYISGHIDKNFLETSFSFCLTEESRADLLDLVILCLTFLAQRCCPILFSHQTLAMFSVVKALSSLTVGRCGMTLCFLGWW